MQKLDAEKLSTLYLEFERLAHRVEKSSTHYQVLGVENGASLEEVKRAYRRAVSLIQPIYSGRYRSNEADSQAMAVRVLRKTSNAFSVLSNFGKRIEYDNALFKKRPGLIPIAGSDADGPIGQLFGETIHEPASRLVVAGTPEYTATFEALSAAPPATEMRRLRTETQGAERRRHERFDLSLPVTIFGHDRMTGEWNEVAETLDVSRLGARVRTKLNLRHGNIVQLKLELPAKLRTHGLNDPVYSVFAIARRIGPPEGGVRTIGLEFLGAKPPDGYSERPWAIFRTKRWSGSERRREEREHRSEVVSVNYLDDSQAILRREVALTENISSSGAMIFVKGAPPETEFVRIANLARSFESLARICDRYVADDGLERLSLNFLDAKWAPE